MTSFEPTPNPQEDSSGNRGSSPQISLAAAVAQAHAGLAALISAELPILRSLRTVERVTLHGRVREALDIVASEIECGAPLSEACQSCTDVFPPAWIEAVARWERANYDTTAFSGLLSTIPEIAGADPLGLPVDVELTNYLGRLGELLAADTSLEVGILQASDGSSPRICRIARQLSLDFRGRNSFASTIQQFPGTFNWILVNLIDCAEEAGTLSAMLIKIGTRQNRAS